MSSCSTIRRPRGRAQDPRGPARPGARPDRSYHGPKAMSEVPEPSATELLRAIQAGDASAFDRLLSLVYAELKQLARGQLARLPPGLTLQPTALVNEAWLRLSERETPDLESRREFLAVAARAMRDIVVEDARKRASLKRGGEWRRSSPELLELPGEAPPEELLALDEALTELEAFDPRKARIVHLRFFAGLSEEETAATLDLSYRTIRREWRFARAWLFERLSEDSG